MLCNLRYNNKQTRYIYIIDGAVVDENNDDFYIDKLNKLDESMNDKTDNFVEKSIRNSRFANHEYKDILFNI